MIQRVTHTFILVTDQDVAKAFYTETLGFAVKEDAVLDEAGGMRWLSVTPPGQDDVEIVLDRIGSHHAPDVQGQLTELVAAGAMSTVIFAVDDCRATADDLKAKGVEFYDEPAERFYGIDAGFRDPFGNPLRMTQRTGVPTQ